MIVDIERKEAALWQSVIFQAALDGSIKPTSTRYKLIKIQATLWFSMENEDFITVCGLAQLSPEDVYERARRLFRRCDCIPPPKGA